MGVTLGLRFLGDLAYPLRPWLMTAYHGHGALTAAQQRFNNRLSRARVIVECALDLLKCPWLHLLKMTEESIDRDGVMMMMMMTIMVQDAEGLRT